MAEETHNVPGKEGLLTTLPKIADLGWKKDNFVFRGWSLDKGSTACYVQDGGSHYFYDDTNLYAIWTPTNYLCFTAAEDGGATIKLPNDASSLPANSLEYSYDKINWTTWTSTSEPITLSNKGSYVYIRSKQKLDLIYNNFVINKYVFVDGNIMSLINDELIDHTIPRTGGGSGCFENLFNGRRQILSVPSLPATTLDTNCYRRMFRGCTNINTAPVLPARYVPQNAYYAMFDECTNLKSAVIYAETLGNSACLFMFNGCTNLRYLEVHFTNFDTGTNSTTMCWLLGTSNTSDCVFKCPLELKTKLEDRTYERNVNTVPSNWTIEAL